MKANAPKRKVFNDAVDLLTGGETVGTDGNGIRMIKIREIKPFHNHPFRLYEGERLDDMVASVKEHGILCPVIVQKTESGYEMLSGHNRMNAADIARIEEIPAIVKEGLTEQEAYVYVIETNLLQRSFSELSITEKAAVLAERYDKVLYQRREEIVSELEAMENVGHDDQHSVGKKNVGHSDQLSGHRDELAQEYGLSTSSVARLLRMNSLCEPLKEMVDDGRLQMMAAVQLSHLPEETQMMAVEAAAGKSISQNAAGRIRYLGEKATRDAVADILSGKKPVAVRKSIKFEMELYDRYFAGKSEKEAVAIIEEALKAWFEGKGADANVH